LVFTAFLFVVLTGEIISMGFNSSFNIEIIHFQIAALGAILQGSIYFFKSQNKSS
jgi:hypothetical protein